mmetsp:Transcript_134038/g.250798  ORF Transcript_134038/g.250798 Transcript_134038/m.250798 type:complete len:213 (+) Transcript_134038:947-1585(+)
MLSGRQPITVLLLELLTPKHIWTRTCMQTSHRHGERVQAARQLALALPTPQAARLALLRAQGFLRAQAAVPRPKGRRQMLHCHPWQRRSSRLRTVGALRLSRLPPGSCHSRQSQAKGSRSRKTMMELPLLQIPQCPRRGLQHHQKQHRQDLRLRSTKRCQRSSRLRASIRGHPRPWSWKALGPANPRKLKPLRQLQAETQRQAANSISRNQT